jgi:outer membrane protein assembly factor BamE (lipoprotein component of BamABCDE complex)
LVENEASPAFICNCFSAFAFLVLCTSGSLLFFYPAIDTTYATGFSDQKFSQIKLAMTKAEVQDALGIPLGVQSSSQGELWSYTRDGKCSWGDWAGLNPV